MSPTEIQKELKEIEKEKEEKMKTHINNMCHIEAILITCNKIHE